MKSNYSTIRKNDRKVSVFFSGIPIVDALDNGSVILIMDDLTLKCHLFITQCRSIALTVYLMKIIPNVSKINFHYLTIQTSSGINQYIPLWISIYTIQKKATIHSAIEPELNLLFSLAGKYHSDASFEKIGIMRK